MAAQEAAYMPVEPFSICIYNAVESLFLPAAGKQLYDFVVCHLY